MVTDQKRETLCEKLQGENFPGEVYDVGNPQSEHDIDLVIIHDVAPECKFKADSKLIDIIKSVFGEDSRIFQDCQFDDYTAKRSIHLLSYLNVINEESPFLVRCFFDKYRSLLGKDNGNKYRKLADSKIKAESPHRAKQYANIAIRQIHHTITNPRSPKDLMNALISANHYAARTLQELNKEYALSVDAEGELSRIRETKNYLQASDIFDVDKCISEQKTIGENLISKLWQAKNSIK